MKRDYNYFTIVLLIIIIATHVYLVAVQALDLENEEMKKFYIGAKGYVSDEVWYVDAARNILRKLFGLQPKQIHCCNATLVYSTKNDAFKASLIASQYGVTVLSTSFNKINAIYVHSNNLSALDLFAKMTNASDVVYGWILGDTEGINTYMNLEHPPMAKYIIALSMILLGDRPFYWRIPSIIMGSLTVIISFLIAKKITGSNELSLIMASAIAVDPLTRNLASIALLDIYVAAFTALAILLAIYGKYKASILVLGFASTFKFTALLAFLPILLLYISNIIREGRKKFVEVFSKSVELLTLALLSFIFFQLLVSIPIIFRLGIDTWLNQSILGAISWHLRIKCVGSECPVASAPWDWFFGLNSFPLYIYSNGVTIYAQGFVPAYLLSFILAILTIAYRKFNSISKRPWILLSGFILAYIILWLAGSRTQYSFYAVQLTPYVYIYLISQLYEYIWRENIVKTFVEWKNVFERIWQIILVILS
ncbi:glycosyltransferase family 39 protein [Ignisphaera sp. 4213-co]|uniref:Glycosyltransferase family 39 protein n=1 Tax=Ignisphaera cupida TaxID=3050454 RepID=A0ABD4Z7J2_9CREN|nr:glycosyltransferase family 39 protein [Ignisphaera sp. 4213-co]MDK6029301.1 glycosyltransferase family 39 protein [Ignisphaera sp. 4213-co]